MARTDPRPDFGFGEVLSSERHGDGQVHAVYPSASASLCGQDRVGRGRGRPGRVTCSVCRDTAIEFSRFTPVPDWLVA